MFVPKTADRAAAAAAVKPIKGWYDTGGVVINTDTLLAWAKVRNSGLVPETVREFADPDGLHLARIILLHNDSDWRCRIMIKSKDSDEPEEVTCDVSMDDWDRARKGCARNIEVLLKAARTDEPKHCEAMAHKGTGIGVCDAVLEGDVCPRARQHVEG